MPVNNPFALMAGIQYVDGTASTATSFTGTVAMSFNASNLIVGLRSDASDNLLVTGTLSHNTAAPIANNFGVLPAVASSAAPTYNAGDQVLLSTDLAGNLRVAATFSGTVSNNITQWAGVTLGSPSNYGTSPGAVEVIGVNAFVTNTVTVAGNLTNNNAAPAATNVGVLPAIASTAAQAYTTGDQVLLNTTLAGATRIDQYSHAGTVLGAPSNYGTSPGAVEVQGVNAFVTNTVPVTLTSTTITGTVAVTQSPSPWVVSLTSTTITGTVAVTQSTSPWVVSGNLTHNNAAPAANNVGVLPAVASTAAPTYTTGDQVLLSTDLAGNLRTTGTSTISGTVTVAGNLTNNNAAPAATNLGVLPAIASTAAQAYTTGDQVLLNTTLTGALRSDLFSWGGTTLGTPTNFGTTPGAVVSGSVNASLFIGTTVAVAASAGVQKVGISGATGVTLDAAQNAAAPANELVTGGVYNTTTPALTAGNASQLQVDSTGSLQVNTEGKKQSYRCGIISVGPLASSSPSISMTGSATKTIRITRVRLSITAATGAVSDISLKKFTTLTGGTANNQSANIAKLDSNNATATAVVNQWAAAATTIVTAGVLAAERYEIVTAAVSVVPGYIEWDFGDKNTQACVLRGTGEFVGIVISLIGTTPVMNCWVEWTEE